MEDEQCLAQIGNAREELVFSEVVHEGTADAKSTARERGLDLALGGDFVEAVLEQAGHVGGIAWRRKRRHGARLGYLASRREHRGTPEAVADEDCGRAGATAQFVRGSDQIGDIGGKSRIGEFTVARAQSGEVEAQHGDTERGEPLGNALGGVDVLAAGKAMRKQRVSARLASGAIEQRGELLSLRVGKIETLSRHALLPFDRGRVCPGKAQQDLRRAESSASAGYRTVNAGPASEPSGRLGTLSPIRDVHAI